MINEHIKSWEFNEMLCSIIIITVILNIINLFATKYNIKFKKTDLYNNFKWYNKGLLYCCIFIIICISSCIIKYAAEKYNKNKDTNKEQDTLIGITRALDYIIL